MCFRFARNNVDAAKVKLCWITGSYPIPYHNDSQFEPVFQMWKKGAKK